MSDVNCVAPRFFVNIKAQGRTRTRASSPARALLAMVMVLYKKSVGDCILSLVSFLVGASRIAHLSIETSNA